MYKLNKYPVISFDVQEARSRVKNGIDYVPMLQEKIGAELRGLPAVLVELKWDKTTDTAIQQIHNRKYSSAFDDYQGEIVLVGVNYNKESKDKNTRVQDRASYEGVGARSSDSLYVIPPTPSRYCQTVTIVAESVLSALPLWIEFPAMRQPMHYRHTLPAPNAFFLQWCTNDKPDPSLVPLSSHRPCASDCEAAPTIYLS